MADADAHPRESHAGYRSSSTSIAKADDFEHAGEVEVGWVKEEDSGETVLTQDPDDFPDGGIQAWSVCIGVRLASDIGDFLG